MWSHNEGLQDRSLFTTGPGPVKPIGTFFTSARVTESL